MANRFNESLLYFAPLHSEFSPGLRIIDNFSDRIAFNIHDKEKDDKHHARQLDDLTLELSSSPSTTIIASKTTLLCPSRTHTPLTISSYGSCYKY